MLPLLRIVWANLSRSRARNLVTGSGVAIAVGLAFCLVSFQQGYQRGMRQELDRLGAHLLVMPKGCPYDAASIALHGASWPCYLKMTYLDSVRRTAHVTVAAPILMTSLYDDRTGAQNVYCGVEPNLLELRRTWRIDGAFPAQPDDVMVGAEAARLHHWSRGERITLPGVPGAPQGTVCGILRPTQGADDLFLFLRLSDAQRLFHHPNELTHMLVRLDDPDQMEDVVRALRGCDAGLEMTVVPLAHLFETIQSLVRSTRVLFGSMALVALLAAGAGVSNTFLTAVTERTREIGIWRAMGASRGTVVLLLWAETVTLCLLGGATGLFLAMGGASGIETWLRGRLPFVPDGSLLQPEAMTAAACLAGSLLLGSLASILPACRAASLSPTEAMRQGKGV